MDQEGTSRLPIAQLAPNIDTSASSIRGVVTILWPYSSSKQTTSVLLVEPEFRLRQKKGQVRVTFRGHSARAIARSGITSGDVLVVYLRGVTWLEKPTLIGTPGRAVDWELQFGRHLRVERLDAAGTSSSIYVDRRSPTPEAEPSVTSPYTPNVEYSPEPHGRLQAFETGIWASPAFLKHASRSPPSFIVDDEIELAENWHEERPYKKARFGRGSREWRFVDRTPSPEKKNGEDDTASLNGVKAAANGTEPTNYGKHQDSLSNTYKASEATTMLIPNEDGLGHRRGSGCTEEIQPSGPASPESRIPETAGGTNLSPSGIHAWSIEDIASAAFSGQGLASDACLSEPAPTQNDNDAEPQQASVSNAKFQSALATSNKGTPKDEQQAQSGFDNLGSPLGDYDPKHDPERTKRNDYGQKAKDIESVALWDETPPNQALLSLEHDYPQQEDETIASNSIERTTVMEEVDGDHTTVIGDGVESAIDEADVEDVTQAVPEVIELGSDETESSDGHPSEALRLSKDDISSIKSLDAEDTRTLSSDELSSMEEGVLFNQRGEIALDNLHLQRHSTEGRDYLYDSVDGRETHPEIQRRPEVLIGNEPSSNQDRLGEENNLLVEVTSEGTGEEAKSGKSISSRHDGDGVHAKQTTESLSMSSPVGSGHKHIFPETDTPLQAKLVDPGVSTLVLPLSPEASSLREQDFSSHSEIQNTDSTVHSSPLEVQQLVTPIATQLVEDMTAPQAHEHERLIYSKDRASRETDGHQTSDAADIASIPKESLTSSNLSIEPVNADTRMKMDAGSMISPDHSHEKDLVKATDAQHLKQTSYDEPKTPIEITVTEVVDTDSVPDEKAASKIFETLPSEDKHTGENEQASPRGLRTSLSYFASLASLEEHFGSHVDVLAVAINSTRPARAKSGPRHMQLSLHLLDQSSQSLSGSFTTAQIYRPSQAALPSVRSGDVVLLRDFKVQSHRRKMMILSTDSSGWAVFRRGEEVQMRGPPIEFGAEEEEHAYELMDWWSSRQEGIRTRSSAKIRAS